MDFGDNLRIAEAIQAVRAAGCTTPGVAELIVKHHGPMIVLSNTHRIGALGDELAETDSPEGREMRALLAAVAAKGMPTTAAEQIAEVSAEEAEAIAYLVDQCGQTERQANEILAREGFEKILTEKKARIGQTNSTTGATAAANAPAAADLAAPGAAAGNSAASS